MNLNTVSARTEYTDIDLNSTGTTVIYNPTAQALIQGVFMPNSGGTVEYQLRVANDESSTALAGANAPRKNDPGEPLEFEHTMLLGEEDRLEINVTTPEGAALSETCVVFRAE